MVQYRETVVIGAGMAGLTVAQQLVSNGVDVLCLEKSRGTGGRLSSKRLSINLMPEDDLATQSATKTLTFDLGCSHFQVSNPQFHSQLKEWEQQGFVHQWPVMDETQTSYVGVPRNSSITRALSASIDCQFNTRVEAIDKSAEGWRVWSEASMDKPPLVVAKHLILATPPQQAQTLLPKEHALLPFMQYEMSAQWVVLLVIEGSLGLPKAFWEPDHGMIQAMSLQNVKPGRERDAGLELWQMTLTPEWTQEHLQAQKTWIADASLHAMAEIVERPARCLSHHVHRWLYAQPTQRPKSQSPFLHSTDGISVCGDYLGVENVSQGVEGAYLSGQALADFLLQSSQT